MGPNRDGEPDDSNLNYPSPGAEGMDAGPFYSTNGRDDTQEHHDHTEQHVDGHVPHQDDQSHLHEDDSQHVSRPANLEELQLAAQLGQGLAGAGMLPATDPNMSVDETSMRGIMTHPDSDHHDTPTYVHDTPTSDHMVQHSMQVPVGPPLGHYNMGDGIPPRKRSKVSRACDECRRKKIKCDAQSDTGEAPCSSCARSAIRCLFSRVPQKRGPSKGYGTLFLFRLAQNLLTAETDISKSSPTELTASRASSSPKAVYHKTKSTSSLMPSAIVPRMELPSWTRLIASARIRASRTSSTHQPPIVKRHGDLNRGHYRRPNRPTRTPTITTHRWRLSRLP